MIRHAPEYHQWYSTYRWRKARMSYLLSHPLCVNCLNFERVVSATVVDHIQDHKGDKNLFWDNKNWQSLCISCHNSKTASSHDKTIYFPENIPLPRMEVIVVIGAPGSGKSTYADNKREKKDLVIDVDVIISQLAKKQIHEADFGTYIHMALNERNRILRELNNSKYDKVWLITTSPKPEHQKFWKETLNAKIIVLEIPRNICYQRIAQDERRKLDTWNLLSKKIIIDKWWHDYRRIPESIVVINENISNKT